MKKLICLVLVCAMLLGMVPAVDAAASVDNFSDVPAGSWYAKAVQYVYDNSLMVGMSSHTFQSDGLTTRAMVVTVLHRMAGKPAPGGTGFVDVAPGAWYADAVLWAQGTGIVQGYGDGTFRPDISITREEMMAVFYRYSKQKGYDVAKTASMRIYTDSVAVQGYAEDAMGWAVSTGLILGFPDGTIRPQDKSNRAQLATVLMRFADQNQIPDDGKDEEDNVITEDDASVLSASDYEIVAGSGKKVTFRVNSTLTVPRFELYVNGTGTGIYLHDNGDYDGCGDDIPNDGCYTAITTLSYDLEDDYIFCATAAVGAGQVKTNDISIFVYHELTDAEMDEMELIDAQLQQIITQTRAEHPSASDQEINELLRQKLMAHLQGLEKQGRVSFIVCDTTNHLITFRFANGTAGGVRYVEFRQNGSVQKGQFSSQTGDIARDSATKASVNSNISIDVNYVTYKERALLLCYDAPVTGWNGGVFEDTTANLTDSLSKVGFEVDARYSVTVGDFLHMQEYDYIHLACHGSRLTLATGLFSSETTSVICTPERATKASKKAYSADLKKDRITIISGEYWIRPSFFDFHYKDKPLKANLVVLGCCHGSQTSELCDSIVNAGAETVLGYSDVVYTAYDYHMSEDILNQMYQGSTASEALTHAKSTYGADDLVWGAAQREGGNANFNTLKSERAECRLFGDSQQKLHSFLFNGDFDHRLGLFFSHPYGWKTYGDARSIFRMAGIEPHSGQRMTVISSGFGSMGSETTSSIYQTFLVPGDASTIEFCYDVVSEEPMEYVGTGYDDLVQVDLLDTDGNVLETLAYESVNTSTWYPIDGINFPGGDDTAYHTRWNKVTSDVLTKYRGQLIVIRFVVQDSGDSIYDTALLVDTVKVT